MRSSLLLLTLAIGQKGYWFHAWPHRVPSNLPGLKRVVGQGDPGIPGETLCRIGKVLDDGTFWVQPLIVGEPPQRCTWSPRALVFPSAGWRKGAIREAKRQLAGRIAHVYVERSAREPWWVRLATENDRFSLPDGLLADGFALPRDQTDPYYARLVADAKAHHRGMYARRRGARR